MSYMPTLTPQTIPTDRQSESAVPWVVSGIFGPAEGSRIFLDSGVTVRHLVRPTLLIVDDRLSGDSERHQETVTWQRKNRPNWTQNIVGFNGFTVIQHTPMSYSYGIQSYMEIQFNIVVPPQVSGPPATHPGPQSPTSKIWRIQTHH